MALRSTLATGFRSGFRSASTSTPVLLWATLVAAACSSDPEGDGPLDGANTTGGESEGSADGAEGNDGATEPGGTEGGSAEGGTAEGGTEGGGGTGSDADPALCEPEGEVDAGFALDTDHWPGGDAFDVDFDVQCEIVDMGDLDGVTIAPTLECDLDGAPQTVAITMADPQLQAPDGQPLVPAFGVGDAVRLRHTGVQDAGGLLGGDDEPQYSHLLLEQFSIHRDDGHLLAAGFRSWGLDAELHAPVTIAVDHEFCGVLTEPSDPDLPMLMTFTLDGVSIDIVGGHAGLLDTTGTGEGLSIVVEVADAVACCHSNRDYDMLLVDMVQPEG